MVTKIPASLDDHTQRTKETSDNRGQYCAACICLRRPEDLPIVSLQKLLPSDSVVLHLCNTHVQGEELTPSLVHIKTQLAVDLLPNATRRLLHFPEFSKK